jgi:hypothetical protein
MAASQFNSQHSEIMLDVSAFHSSPVPSSQPMARDQPTVALSPVVQASQSEDRVPESVERIEDSYQESMPNRPPIQPTDTDDDDEDELYAISPKGRASLDAKIAAKKNTSAEQVSYNS